MTDCPTCKCTDRREELTPDGPHHAKEVCAGCGRYFRWVPRPKGDRAKRPAAHRNLVKKFSRGFCEWCLRKEEDLPASQVLEGHHIVQFEQGGSDDRSNVSILCTGCHKLTHWARTYVNAEAKYAEVPG